MKTKLAIFDLDGTLFDTNEVNYHAYHDALLPYGVELDRDYYVSQCNGKQYKEFLPAVMNSVTNIEEVHRAKKRLYVDCLNYARCNEHLLSIAQMLIPEYFLAIVTTASRKNAQDILRYFGQETLFDLLVTQEDIHRTKPDPDGFLQAMDYFGIPSNHTIIFEDSDVGIQAAIASGASVYKVVRF